MAGKITNFGLLMKDGAEGTSFAVDMQKLPSNEPIAYARGFVTALRGNNMSKGGGLAKAYVAGWDHGQRVFSEGEVLPDWVNKVE